MDSDYGVARELSDLQKLRSLYKPELPPCLQGTTVRVEFGDATTAADPTGSHTISRSFPHTYGQPIAHFLRATAKVPDGGSEGLFAQKTLEVTDEVLATYKNQGGYDLLGRTQDQIRTTEQVNAAHNACTTLKLDALVIIGGVTSNTDAAQLSETFAERKCPTKVVGIPVTLNGDLKNQFVEANVGFDTICKVNSQLISNVCTDALSAEKVILAEEVAASKLTLFDITKQICDAVCKLGVNKEIHGLLRQGVSAEKISAQLSPWASALFEFLPPFIRKQNPVNKWRCGAAPITAMMTVRRYGHGPGASNLGKPALHPAIVDLKGKAYELLRQNATKFLMDDVYRNPGPLQFEGPGADAKAVTLCVEDQDYMGRIKKLQEHLDKVRAIVKPGCSQDVLKAALSAMASVTDILSVMSSSSTGNSPCFAEEDD
ncbi:Pyrophosphate--fructose 6-phosphate 1-phosphotransferase subunit alpha 1 [Striga hermonthica]|uniref:Pyrophosphate--fructose 6-phosphate 1-phosphotransferase subunit alpha 1 n=1 Tax=Striga hermonthica TaxID=68872 RepID=A0A9N7NI02_STRHE|nr:Pyrophosphate--fructose 6-phosphate 1-phosphotransferase subunit alpha 1 [Striga hermonthica]